MHPSARVKELGREAGFDLVRIVSVQSLEIERGRYLAWIGEGRQGEMRWMTPDRAVRSSHPRTVLSDARSIISVAMEYGGGLPPAARHLTGRVARYAWGADYHQVLGEKLQLFSAALQDEYGGQHRWYVDTGPLMDKALAVRSGLGWYGKNTNILTERFGSWVVLGEIVTTLGIEPDASLNRDCGACRLCSVACPTGALQPDYSIDARLCISYLTIEHRGPIPRELRASMGNWVYGCDICQEVCPPSQKPYLASSEDSAQWKTLVRGYVGREDSTDSKDLEIRQPVDPENGTGAHATYDLIWLLKLTHEQYLAAFRGTAVRRAKVWMLRRNAAVALGNSGNAECVAPLLGALGGDEHPVVRSHAAWALGRLSSRLPSVVVKEQLVNALACEAEEQVREEIEAAIELSR